MCIRARADTALRPRRASAPARPSEGHGVSTVGEPGRFGRHDQIQGTDQNHPLGRDVTLNMMKQLTAGEHDLALSTGTAVLVFLLDSSPACQQFRPELERLSARRLDVSFYLVDPTTEARLAQAHTLGALPTIIVYRDGLPLRRETGALPETDLEDLLDEVIHADMDDERADWLLDLAENGAPLSPSFSNHA
jgi:thioredoxin-like negative regulator of GroEL